MLKRVLDVLGAFLALLLSAPVSAVAALATLVSLGRPVLFRQERPGLHGRPFVLLKFRTMREAVGPTGEPLPDADRLTRVGAWLRRLSIDELPQFWNVLRGDMSLVGPRPLLMEYLSLYTPEQARRHAVKPGLTGWTQVCGRNALTWEEKFQLDRWYVDHQSLALDTRILLLTVVKAVSGAGVAHDGEATMPRFTGTSVESKR